VPLRTARGAGRAAGRRFAGRRDAVRPRVVRALVALLGDFRALRVRVLEPPRPLLLDLDVDVLLLREPGGEDVRVAMRPN